MLIQVDKRDTNGIISISVVHRKEISKSFVFLIYHELKTPLVEMAYLLGVQNEIQAV